MTAWRAGGVCGGAGHGLGEQGVGRGEAGARRGRGERGAERSMRDGRHREEGQIGKPEIFCNVTKISLRFRKRLILWNGWSNY
jgi:hypothetical protein